MAPTIVEPPSNDRRTFVEPALIVRRTTVEPPSNDRRTIFEGPITSSVSPRLRRRKHWPLICWPRRSAGGRALTITPWRSPTCRYGRHFPTLVEELVMKKRILVSIAVLIALSRPRRRLQGTGAGSESAAPQTGRPPNRSPRPRIGRHRRSRRRVDEAQPSNPRFVRTLTNVQIELTLTDQIGTAAPEKKTVSMIVASGNWGKIRNSRRLAVGDRARSASQCRCASVCVGGRARSSSS